MEWRVWDILCGSPGSVVLRGLLRIWSLNRLCLFDGLFRKYALAVF